MRYLANLLHNQKILLALSFIFLLLSSLLILISSAARPSEMTVTTNNSNAMSSAVTPTVTLTKWWIKVTATTLPSILTAPTGFAEPKANNCPELSSPYIRAETYAYIALTPPVPNRIRAGASLSSSYVGQFEPGAGLTLIDGPICADGYSWWLVESLDKRLRGWTVEGRNSEQWLIPCPIVDVQCSFLATPTPQKVIPPDDNPANPPENTCKSDKLTVGMLAHVDQDSLLVVRAEPSVGAVIGHAGPMSIVNVLEGPSCVGAAIWWKVNVLDLGLTGWTTENYLEACPKDSQCNQ